MRFWLPQVWRKLITFLFALTCVDVKFYGAFVLHRRVDLHAIDAMPARWRGGADSSPLDGASTARPRHRREMTS